MINYLILQYALTNHLEIHSLKIQCLYLKIYRFIMYLKAVNLGMYIVCLSRCIQNICMINNDNIAPRYYRRKIGTPFIFVLIIGNNRICNISVSRMSSREDNIFSPLSLRHWRHVCFAALMPTSSICHTDSLLMLT